jgi:hypothetical protein
MGGGASAALDCPSCKGSDGSGVTADGLKVGMLPRAALDRVMAIRRTDRRSPARRSTVFPG